MNLRYWTQSKKNRKRWTMLTAYDAMTAELLASEGIDLLLVGDSVGMVLLGYESTVPVTMDEMIHHAKAVRRGAPKAFVIGDMPWKAVRHGVPEAYKAARRFIREGGCDAVKVEWGPKAFEITRRLVKAKIPVMGHLGLTPQTASRSGGFKVQARSASDAARLYRRAKEWESLGVFSILLECVPVNVAKAVTSHLRIPVMGIGAGPDCDGQVLVFQDVVGLFRKFKPKFVKNYADAHALFRTAVSRYAEDVRKGAFPSQKHSFHMDRGEIMRFERLI
jgi:3-methyl-2-oxobutanoate hydroxymethyltransferase